MAFPLRNICRIAGKVGYRDEKYFYRISKAKYGFTPDEYRKRNASPLPPSWEG
ncbi:AraC family transcriptional regulator [Paenibacillus sp. URB8-2]|uniref:AraC family transcriptional regulator n=1 Tax=Paenibacillus sp. URB8-2 TaxID=2741301 RepID=UPI003FA7374C